MIYLVRYLVAESAEPAWKLVLPTLVASVINGALIALVVHASEQAHATDHTWTDFLLFLLLFASLVVTRMYSANATGNLLVDVVARVQARIVRRIEQTELLGYEAIGHERIYMSLSKDTATLSEAAVEVAKAASGLVIVLCSLFYIAFLSLTAFAIVILMLSASTFIFLKMQQQVFVGIRQAAIHEHRYYGLISQILAGFAQLRIDPSLRAELIGKRLQAARSEVTAQEKRNEQDMAWVRVMIGAAFYVILGVLLFVWTRFHDEGPLLVGRIVSIVQFITGPITQTVGSLSALGRAASAIESLTELEASLQGSAEAAEPAESPTLISPTPFVSLIARDMFFQYPARGEEPGFKVGTPSFSLKRGEIVFLIGGNGSGKSTFLKTLCGLYAHRGGDLEINGVSASQQIEHHRSFFSIIFQDFHLFDAVYNTEGFDVARANQLLHRLGIGHRTQFLENGQITEVNLSVGQRKRLALVMAMMDRREVFLLDEWAADQDPDFRRIFYRELLPELRASGRTVIAATHDDHYFDVADHIYLLGEGAARRLTDDERLRYQR
jgi:putative ATP-binding cassette transporter